MVRRPSVVVRRRPSLTISKIFFSKTAWPIKAKFYVEPPWVGGTKVCSRHLGHMKTVEFSETIEACDLKVGRYRQLNDFMKVCEY